MPPNYEQPSSAPNGDVQAYAALCAGVRRQLDKPVVLVGMMGSGKSSVGPRLARDLDLPYHDADALIAEQAGKPIPAIFRDDGEAHFRQLEAAMLAELIGRGISVIASGGGALTTPATAGLIAAQTLSIWLQADIPVILRRTRGSDRPLLQDVDPASRLRELMEKREHLYARADIHFSTNRGKPAGQARQLVDLLAQQRQN